MHYNVYSEKQYRTLLKHETFKRLGASFHPVYSGWRGPGVYSLEPVFFNEAGLVWKHAFPAKPSAPVQMAFNI